MSRVNGSVTATADPLDSVDYDPIDHLNALFSHPTTLSSVPSVSASLQRYRDDLDADISSLVTAQTTSDNDSIQRIQEAKAELATLFAKIEGVRERALQTERTITEMTADIKRLDSTKKNLTLSMTALKRLQMLTTAYEQLRSMSKSRQYRDCAHLLQAVLQLMAHFKSYRSIDQIAALSKNVAELQRELLEQVCEDFEITFARSEVQLKRNMLREACEVMDALGEHARSRLITWYCNTQLREYRQVFRGNDEAGNLDNISRRYSWFNRMLKTYDAEHAMLFPAHWRVNEMLANAFCEGTRDDYKSILQRSMRRADGQPPDVNLLLSCLQETLDFEHSLEKRFSAGRGRTSVDTELSTEDKRQGFSQAISEAFEPYLSIWVESQDKQLATLIPKYRLQPVKPVEEEFHAQLVIPSSTELFHQYRITLAQCAKLSTGGRLEELSKTFAKYLDAYSSQVLFYLLSEKSGSNGPSIEDIVIILNTADYCYQTTGQLEDRIKQRIDEDLREKVDLQSQADSFIGVASQAVRTLVHKTEVDCDAAWREMRNVPWAKLDVVGDQSDYVSSLTTRVKDRSREILKLLHKQQYARAYCDNLVDTLTNAYISNIVACRPLSETNAEQLLLDSYALKKAFSDLLTLNADPGTPPNASFAKRVNQATSAKLDPLLKTLQVRASPPEGLVQAYLIHIKDKSEPNFRKILEIKGITTKREQAHLIELFNAHKASPANEQSLQASNALIASLTLTAVPSSSAAAVSSGLAALKDSAAAHSSPSLPARFDPSNFGSSLMTAAKEGIDRFGSPHLGVSSGSGGRDAAGGVAGTGAASTGNMASRATSPPMGVEASDAAAAGGTGTGTGFTGPQATINENLKKMGNFFRRDVSSFGGFGRKGEDAAGVRKSLDRK